MSGSVSGPAATSSPVEVASDGVTHIEVSARGGRGSYLAAGATVEARNAEMSRRAKLRHSLDAYIKSIVERATELTPEQITRLRDALPPVDHAPGPRAVVDASATVDELAAV